MKYRIGIDVGGTFTHAVAIDNSDYSLKGQVKVPTTHRSERGVAQGIIDSLFTLLKDCSIEPHDVTFIAHSTTQATNALLEGDVAMVGVIAVGEGLEGKRVRQETEIGDIDLDNGKKLKVVTRFIEKKDLNGENIKRTVAGLKESGVRAIVAAEAFSVDDPANEKNIVSIALKEGLCAAGTHEISGLYGLRMRTRTAVVNASIMPKMLETAEATAACVKEAGITAPLMIMRSDGGVMSIDEMKKRPILTILSGPAAGVASALLYVKVSDGIFLEVGGTSTDICVIRNGKALVRSAEIGGNKLYLRTIDSRTVGIAGGSLPRMEGGKIVDVGPRSAHIAGLSYCAFSDAKEIGASSVKEMQPLPGDPKGYFSLGGKFGITTTCAANLLGMVKETDYAFGSKGSAEAGFAKIGGAAAAGTLLKIASAKIIKVIDSLVKDYKLERDSVTLIGGGGGAAAIVPSAAKETGMPYRIAENHAVISAIGAALAMLTDTIERSAIDPGEEDIAKIRRDAEESLARMGAERGTIEVTVSVDRRNNVLRATATGTTELRKKELLVNELSSEQKQKIAADSMKKDPSAVKMLASTGYYDVWGSQEEKNSFFGLIKNIKRPLRVMDAEGIIRISKSNAEAVPAVKGDAETVLSSILEKFVVYGDAGEKVPEIQALIGSRIADLSGLVSAAQIVSLFDVEIRTADEDERIAFIVSI